MSDIFKDPETYITPELIENLARFLWIVSVLNNSIIGGKTRRVYYLKYERTLNKIDSKHGITRKEVVRACAEIGEECPSYKEWVNLPTKAEIRKEVKPIPFPG